MKAEKVFICNVLLFEMAKKIRQVLPSSRSVIIDFFLDGAAQMCLRSEEIIKHYI